MTKIRTNEKKPSIVFSNKAFIVSFMMSILVIYIHANNLHYYGLQNSSGNIAYIIVKIIGTVLGGVAVPFFFMISGYWFFRFNIFNHNSTDILKSKMKKKVNTVLIPYIIWNCFGMVFYMVVTRIPTLSGMMNNGKIIGITLENVLSGVFLHKYYFIFLYMQDLIILTILTPVFILMLRKKYISIIGMGIIFLVTYFDVNIPLINSSSVWFFLIGGFLAVYYQEFFEKKSEKSYLWFLLFILYMIVMYFEIPVIAKIGYLISPFVMWKAMDFIIGEKQLNQKVSWFKKQSFFIYAVHVIPVTVVGHIFTWFGSGTGWALFSYFMTPIVTIMGIYILAFILKRWTPKLYDIIVGNRG